MEYYQRIRNVREDRDLKQYQFANLIGVLPKTYNLYEIGLRSIPVLVMNKILLEFDLSLDYILGLTERRKYPSLQDIDVDVLANNLKIYRNRMNMTQKEMALRLNCSQQALSEYEHGNLTIPFDTLKKFCEVVHVSADTISGRTKEIHKLPNIPV